MSIRPGSIKIVKNHKNLKQKEDLLKSMLNIDSRDVNNIEARIKDNEIKVKIMCPLSSYKNTSIYFTNFIEVNSDEHTEVSQIKKLKDVVMPIIELPFDSFERVIDDRTEGQKLERIIKLYDIYAKRHKKRGLGMAHFRLFEKFNFNDRHRVFGYNTQVNGENTLFIYFLDPHHLLVTEPLNAKDYFSLRSLDSHSYCISNVR